MSNKRQAHVTPEPAFAERRKRPRKKSPLQATLVTANGSFDCRVLDFSPSGAKVEFVHPLAKKEKVTLILRPIGTFTGLVAWGGSGCFGMQFLGQSPRAGATPLDIAAAVSALKAPAQLAAYLLAKQDSRVSAKLDALLAGRSSAADSAPSPTDAAPVLIMNPGPATLDPSPPSRTAHPHRPGDRMRRRSAAKLTNSA